MITIGVDIGGGHILSAAIDTDESRIIDESRSYVKVNNKGTLEEIMVTWAKALNETLGKIDISKLNGIGFAMPGPFNYKTGLALLKGNDKYEALYNVNVNISLADYLVDPSIPMRFMNDATSFAVGVSWFGEAKKATRSIAITLGTGFGSAYIENGIPVVKREDVPEHGCLWHVPYKDGIADDYFSTRWYLQEYQKLTGSSVNGVKEVAERARLDHDVKNIFKRFGENLGEFFTPWLKKFPADIIVMGGNVTGAFDLYGPAFTDALAVNGLAPEVAISNLMEDAALIGSARLFEESFWERIKNDLPIE